MKSFLIFLDRVRFVWLGAAAAFALVAFAFAYLWAGSYGQGLVPTYGSGRRRHNSQSVCISAW